MMTKNWFIVNCKKNYNLCDMKNKLELLMAFEESGNSWNNTDKAMKQARFVATPFEVFSVCRVEYSNESVGDPTPDARQLET